MRRARWAAGAGHARLWRLLEQACGFTDRTALCLGLRRCTPCVESWSCAQIKMLQAPCRCLSVQANRELVWVGAVQVPAGSWEAKQATGAAAAASRTAGMKQVRSWARLGWAAVFCLLIPNLACIFGQCVCRPALPLSPHSRRPVNCCAGQAGGRGAGVDGRTAGAPRQHARHRPCSHMCRTDRSRHLGTARRCCHAGSRAACPRRSAAGCDG